MSNEVNLLPFWPEWFKVEHTNPMHPATTVNTADHPGSRREGWYECLQYKNVNASLRFFLNGIVFHFNK